MRQTKRICLLAAAAVLTLGPISTGQTQPQTVYASQVSGDKCIDWHNGWFSCPNGDGTVTDIYKPNDKTQKDRKPDNKTHNNSKPNHKTHQYSWLGVMFGIFSSVWYSFSSLF